MASGGRKLTGPRCKRLPPSDMHLARLRDGHESPRDAQTESGTMDIPIGLTFDDVLLRPAESDILPSMADTSTFLTLSLIHI